MKLNTYCKYGTCVVIFSLLCAGLSKLFTPLLSVANPNPEAAPDSITRDRASAIYNKLPLGFEANEGQTDKSVKFVSRGKGYSLFLTPKQAVLTLRKPTNTVKQVKDTVLRMEWVGANRTPQVVGLNPLPGKSNYFIGKDPKNWRTNIPVFSQVKYRSIYPGIDLVYYGNQQQLEYDWVVAAGANPRAIELKITGANRLSVDKNGDLVLHTSGGEVRQHRPHIYQHINGQKKTVTGRYVLLGKQEVGFAIASYDRSKTLTIDPVLSYSTYLGGSGNDSTTKIAVDLQGNAYVIGQTASLDFPTKNALDTSPHNNFTAFVTKLNPKASGDGSLIYSTYLGGSGTQGLGETGRGIAVDPQLNVYATGIAYSSDFPTTPNALDRTLGGLSDAFVTKLNSKGDRLLYSTYLGGSTAADSGFGIAVDLQGNIYVTGEAYSSDFPTKNGFSSNLSGGNNDVFVTKLNPDASGQASLLYSSYLGGSRFDTGFGIAVDRQGNAHLTGLTFSSDFPLKNGFDTAFTGSVNDPEAFVTKIDTTAVGATSLVYSTYLGGSGAELGRDIAVDRSGNIYVTGRTQSADFPTQNALNSTLKGTQDAFVTKVNPGKLGSDSLVYSTYLGGNSIDEGFGIFVTSKDNVYLTGSTNSTDFPIENAFDSTLNGGSDAFVARLNPKGDRLLFSSYLGGGGFDNAYAIAVDMRRNIYVTGNTTSSDFPTKNAFDNTLGGDSDAFVTKINERQMFGEEQYEGEVFNRR